MYLLVYRYEGHKSGIEKAKIIGTYVEAKQKAIEYVGKDYTVSMRVNLSPTVHEELRSVHDEEHVTKVATIMMVD